MAKCVLILKTDLHISQPVSINLHIHMHTVLCDFFSHSLASAIPPPVMANVASLSGMSGLS